MAPPRGIGKRQIHKTGRKKKRSTGVIEIVTEETTKIKDKILAVSILEKTLTLIPDSSLEELSSVLRLGEIGATVHSTSNLTSLCSNGWSGHRAELRLAMAALIWCCHPSSTMASSLYAQACQDSNREMEYRVAFRVVCQIEATRRQSPSCDGDFEAKRKRFDSRGSVIRRLCVLLTRLSNLCFDINCAVKSAAYAGIAHLLETSSSRKRRLTFLELRALLFVGQVGIAEQKYNSYGDCLRRGQRRRLWEFFEQYWGIYDWTNIHRRCFERPDRSFVLNEFYGCVAATRVSGKGFGVVANKRLVEGELVHVGRPIAVGNDERPLPPPIRRDYPGVDRSQFDLARRLSSLSTLDADWHHRMRFMATGDQQMDARRPEPFIHELRGCAPVFLPYLPWQFVRLQQELFCNSSTLSSSSLSWSPPPSPSPDIRFKEALDMVFVSSFDARSVWHSEDLEALPEETGQWLLPSLVNHSFKSNVSWNIVGSNYVIRATRDIEIGEELTFAYLLPRSFRERVEYCEWKGMSPEMSASLAEKVSEIDGEMEAIEEMKNEARNLLHKALNRLKKLKKKHGADLHKDFVVGQIARQEAELNHGLGDVESRLTALSACYDAEAQSFTSPPTMAKTLRVLQEIKLFQEWIDGTTKMRERLMRNQYGIRDFPFVLRFNDSETVSQMPNY